MKNKNVTKNVTALILAAGYSSRMGEFKPLLSFNGGCAVEGLVTRFKKAGIEDIRVVVGHRADELIPLVEKWGARTIMNSRYHEGMFSSVIAGIKTLDREQDGFCIMPVDVPLVRTQTIREVLKTYDRTGTIVYPVFNGKRGHPPVIGRHYGDKILSWKDGGGLRKCLEQFEDHAEDVEVADEFMLCDMDTPDDFRSLLRRYEQYDIPSVGECIALLEKKYCVKKKGMDHALGVARIAVRLGRALNHRGMNLNVRLIAAGALLHDLAKGMPDHAAAGAAILRQYGFPRVADIVAKHMDLGVVDERVLSETEIVYVADKLVQAGGRGTSLESRFEEKLRRFGHDPEARRAIAVRQAHAVCIRRALESRLGPLEPLLVEPGDRNETPTIAELLHSTGTGENFAFPNHEAR